MRILVTGTAGFIGFHLARKLLAGGHEVAGYDNFNEYYAVEIKHRRNAELEADARFRLFRAELTDLAAVERCFDEFQPEIVVNLAAQAGVRYSLINPFAYTESNITGFINVLETSKRRGVKRFVYASSSSVYGGLTEMPFSEKQRVDTPISLYAATKKANELIAHSYSHLFGLQTVGLRFFTVYGPWGRPDMAMWIFLEKMLAGEPIPVFNHGKMMRDFTYIDDIVQGVEKLMFTPNLKTYEVMNIGNHNSEDLMRVVKLLESAAGVTAKIDLLPMQPGDVPATFADIDQIHAATGYEPTTNIDVGVPNFVKWYLDHPDLAALARAKRN